MMTVFEDARLVLAVVVPLVAFVAIPAIKGYANSRLAARWREESQKRQDGHDAEIAELRDRLDKADRTHLQEHGAIEGKLKRLDERLDEGIGRIEKAIANHREQSSDEHKEANERLRCLERELSRIKGFAAGREKQ